MEEKIKLANSLGFIQDIENSNLFHFEGDWNSCIYIDDNLKVIPCLTLT